MAQSPQHGVFYHMSNWFSDDDSANYRRFVRFGMVDSSIMVLCILAGFSLESLLAKRLAKGYGALLGAGAGNAIAGFVAGMPEGKSAALGVLTGASVPLIPVVGALALRKNLTGNTAKLVAASSATLCVGTFFHSYWKPSQPKQSEHSSSPSAHTNTISSSMHVTPQVRNENSASAGR